VSLAGILEIILHLTVGAEQKSAVYILRILLAGKEYQARHHKTYFQ
jgi:hypothetical protein